MAISTAKPTVRRNPAAQAADGPEPAALAPLTPAVFQIMLALAEREAHGYGIMQDVARLTNGETRLGPGTLYRSIQRMLVDGLIEELPLALVSEGRESDIERRRYYRLTERGRTAARAEAARLAALVDAARRRNLIGKRGEKN